MKNAETLKKQIGKLNNEGGELLKTCNAYDLALALLRREKENADAFAYCVLGQKYAKEWEHEAKRYATAYERINTQAQKLTNEVIRIYDKINELEITLAQLNK